MARVCPYIGGMRKLLSICLISSSIALSVQAEEQSDLQDGMDLLSEGTQLLLRGLMGEIEPALRDLEAALKDMTLYHPPEVLPNGDIIIRRKTPDEIDAEPSEEGEIEL